jgi:hypothetical protein
MRRKTIEEAARTYGRAYVAKRESVGFAGGFAVIEADAAHHDLLLAVLDRCVVCEPGTCPGFIINR